MDELCRELSQKVKCDGSMPVMDSNEPPCEELVKAVIQNVAQKKNNAAPAMGQPQNTGTVSSPTPATHSAFGASSGNPSSSSMDFVSTMPEPIQQTPAQQQMPQQTQQQLQLQQQQEAMALAVKNFLAPFGMTASFGTTGTQLQQQQQQMAMQMLMQQANGSLTAANGASTSGQASSSHFGQTMDVTSNNAGSQQPQQQPQQSSSFFPPEASWSNMLLDAPSPNTQFMNIINGTNVNSDAMTSLMGNSGTPEMLAANTYFNFTPPDKE